MTTLTPCEAVTTAQPAGGQNPNWTLAATILGSSVAFIDGSVVNVALPALQKDLHADPAALSWAINAYLLPLGALILLGGGAGDHFGRRRLFLIGLFTFTAASLGCAAAPTMPMLLVARGFQGLGAALLMPNSLAILGATFAGETRGRAIGIWAASGALFGAVGPLLGGWLVDTVGWRVIFLLNVPIASAAAWLAWRHVAESHDSGRAPLDWAGAALATVALALLTWALTTASETSAGLATWSAVLAGIVLFGAFLWLERRRGDRAIMPLFLFTRPFIGLTLLTFLLYGALGGLFVLLPFRLIRVEGFSAVSAGAALLPLPVLIGLGSPLMGRLTGRIGGRLPLAIGSAIVTVGLLLYARLDAAGVTWTDLLPATLVVGLGMAVCVAPLTTTVMASVDAGHVGAASGLNSAVARVAGLVATALLGGAFALQGEPAAFLGAFRMAALVAAGSAALASVTAIALVRPRA